ncbi:hypothetical protein [Mesorhizobium sp. CN2-181]|uniref:hypothetical protein n=1 Tax=Mesorhizobium yinganensis TaxID=3157707 RepID=UPI0032B7B2F1
MIELKKIAVDIEAEREGRWVRYPDWEGVWFHVRGLQLPAYQTHKDRVERAFAPKAKDSDKDKQDRYAAKAEVIGQHLLLGWHGFDTPYVAAEAKARLADTSYRELLGAVVWCAAQVSASPASRSAIVQSEPPSDGE